MVSQKIMFKKESKGKKPLIQNYRKGKNGNCINSNLEDCSCKSKTPCKFQKYNDGAEPLCRKLVQKKEI